MEFLDEDARPRFMFQSKPAPSSTTTQQNQNPTKPLLLITITITISSLLLLFSIFYLQTEPIKSLIFWLSLSLFLGPFAPSHLTAGHIRVGYGPIIEPITQQTESEPETKKKSHQKRPKPVRSEEISTIISQPISINENPNGKVVTQSDSNSDIEVKEWSGEDIEMLKKQLVKNPVGKLRRWEIIAEVFNGRHKVDSVIKKAKEMSERKVDDGDDYVKFLKNRKQLESSRGSVGNEVVVVENGESKKESNGWNSGEDIALLNALKAFPKDVAMRWEKIAAAVPGKSKAACVKRVSELKKDFRSSKAGAEG